MFSHNLESHKIQRRESFMPNKTKILSPEKIAFLVENVKKANPIKTDSIDFDRVKENPAFKALPELEQSVYLMFLHGMLHKDIAEALAISRFRVTRLIGIAKGKIRYLLRVKGEMLNDRDYMRKFCYPEEKDLVKQDSFYLGLKL